MGEYFKSVPQDTRTKLKKNEKVMGGLLDYTLPTVTKKDLFLEIRILPCAWCLFAYYYHAMYFKLDNFVSTYISIQYYIL